MDFNDPFFKLMGLWFHGPALSFPITDYMTWGKEGEVIYGAINAKHYFPIIDYSKIKCNL